MYYNYGRIYRNISFFKKILRKVRVDFSLSNEFHQVFQFERGWLTCQNQTFFKIQNFQTTCGFKILEFPFPLIYLDNGRLSSEDKLQIC